MTEENKTDVIQPEVVESEVVQPEPVKPEVVQPDVVPAKKVKSSKKIVEPETTADVFPDSEKISQSVTNELEQLRKQVTELAIQSLIKERNVPKQIQKLIPTDLSLARQFLESDEYQSLVQDLEKISELEKAKSELEEKLNAINKPQQVETTTIPTENTEPAKSIPKKKWEDLQTSDLASIGSLFLNNL